MYGGAVFDLDGRHFDIHYRNLDVVEHWTREAEAGRFEVHILGFHLAGIPTYMLTGSWRSDGRCGAISPCPTYPDELRRRAPGVWLGRADRELVDWADLTSLYRRFSALGSSTAELSEAIREVRGAIAEIESEVARGVAGGA